MRNLLVPVLLSAGLAVGVSAPAFGDAPCGGCSPQPPALPSSPVCTAGPCPRFEVVDESGSRLPTYAHEGRSYVEGDVGARYLIHVVNPSPRRIEAVVSVDGLDAIDGRPASVTKRGYVVPAYGDVTIDGWRTSLGTVAAFRFSPVRDSYAARTGHDRNVGVIGVAFFGERARPVWRPPADIAGESAAPASPAGRPAADASRGAGASERAAPPAAQKAERPGLGTEFGEAHASPVEQVAFVRAQPTPFAVVRMWYDDREGLAAMGVPVLRRDPRDLERELRQTAEPFAERFAQPPP